MPPVRPTPRAAPVTGVSRAEARAFESVDRLPREPERPREGAPAPQKDLAELVGELSDLVQAVRRELRFSVDEESGRTVIRVVDSETGELVRQIPPEEVVNLVGRFKAEQAGLVSEQA
jgi:flagellar protein FlaG